MDMRFAHLQAGMYSVAQSFSKKRKKWLPKWFLPWKRTMEDKPQSREELCKQIIETFKGLGMETDE